MPLPKNLAHHTLTIKSPGKRLVYGSEVDDWSPEKVTTRTLERCIVEAKSTDENNNRRDTTTETYDVLIPASKDEEKRPPSSRDRIKHPLASGDFTVNGKAMPVADGRGRVDHYFCNVKRWSEGG